MNYHPLQNLFLFVFTFIVVLLPKTAHLEEVRKVPNRPAEQWYQDNAHSGPVQLIVSIPDQKMNVYQNGEHIIETRVSSGRPGYNTPAGIFSILGKRREHYSNLYDDAPMPFMQRLTWSGIALHAGNVSRRYASHGCVRMPHDFARKLFRYTRRGVHVVITNEHVRPKIIAHKNLISPTPRLIAIPDENPGTAMGLTTQAFASPHEDKKSIKSTRYKRVPTPAEARLEGLKAEKLKNKNDIATTRDLIKEQKQEIKKTWAAYWKEKKRITGLDYKHKHLLKQVNQARKYLSYVKRLSRSKLVKSSKWLDITEIKQSKLYDKLLQLNTEIASFRKQRDELVTAQENTSKIEKQISALQRQHSRLLKQITLAEKKVATAKSYVATQQTKATSSIEKTENKFLHLKNKLAAFNVNFLPLKQKYDQIKKAYEKAQTDAKETQDAYNKLQRNLAKLSRNIKQARRAVRLQKKPLRILLTKSTRQHKVKDIQQALVDLGYGVDKVDGLYGQETIRIIRQYQKANNLKISGLINDDLINSIRNNLGREPLNAGHIYVRQDFMDIFDAPVSILDPERSLGTHFYTVMKFDKTDSQARWNVVTIKSRKQLAEVKSNPIITNSVKTPSAAEEALDRITLPEKVRNFLTRRLTPGSSFIITDKGYSDETGKGTDFIVLAR